MTKKSVPANSEILEIFLVFLTLDKKYKYKILCVEFSNHIYSHVLTYIITTLF